MIEKLLNRGRMTPGTDYALAYALGISAGVLFPTRIAVGFGIGFVVLLAAVNFGYYKGKGGTTNAR